MLWYWDTGASHVDLDGREARQLAGIARDPAIDRVVEDISKKTELSLHPLEANFNSCKRKISIQGRCTRCFIQVNGSLWKEASSN